MQNMLHISQEWFFSPFQQVIKKILYKWSLLSEQPVNFFNYVSYQKGKTSLQNICCHTSTLLEVK